MHDLEKYRAGNERMLHRILKERYQLTEYQIAQLKFLFYTIFSEISKFVIMLILFHRQFLLYLFTIILLCLIRASAGGFHCNTYVGCLALSISYVFLSMDILPMIEIAKIHQILLLAISICINFILAPLSSLKHIPLGASAIRRYKRLSTALLCLYFFLMLITPENPYTTSGFWVIILHTVQLLVAAIQKKGVYHANNCKITS